MPRQWSWTGSRIARRQPCRVPVWCARIRCAKSALCSRVDRNGAMRLDVDFGTSATETIADGRRAWRWRKVALRSQSVPLPVRPCGNALTRMAKRCPEGRRRAAMARAPATIGVPRCAAAWRPASWRRRPAPRPQPQSKQRTTPGSAWLARCLRLRSRRPSVSATNAAAGCRPAMKTPASGAMAALVDEVLPREPLRRPIGHASQAGSRLEGQVRPGPRPYARAAIGRTGRSSSACIRAMSRIARRLDLQSAITQACSA